MSDALDAVNALIQEIGWQRTHDDAEQINILALQARTDLKDGAPEAAFGKISDLWSRLRRRQTRDQPRHYITLIQRARKARKAIDLNHKSPSHEETK